MSIALFTTPGILTPLQGFFRWFVSGTAPVVRHRHPAASGKCTDDVRIRPIVACVHPLKAAAPRHSRVSVGTPLRIVRIMEAGQPPAHAGRMVISGRIADVCAELDRLSAREATQP